MCAIEKFSSVASLALEFNLAILVEPVYVDRNICIEDRVELIAIAPARNNFTT
jgi:hypothetical protein